MANFNGSLNTNEFYNSLYNGYRFITTIADSLDGLDDSLANKYRADGGMYHDQSVWTDMDIPFSAIWDPDDTNVLEPEFKVKPVQQKIVVNRFRQIGLYTDEYLSKRAWMDPSSYDQFRSVVQKTIGDTKRVYEQRLVDTFVGGLTRKTIELTLPTDADAKKQNELQATAIAKQVADLMVTLKDSTRDFNTYGFIKSFNESDFDIVWNADFYNKMRYVDLPGIFHTEGLLKAGRALPAHYFGTPLASSTTPATANGQIAAEEYFITVDSSGKYAAPATATYAVHIFPGEYLPEGTPVKDATDTRSDSFTTASVIVQFNGIDRSRKMTVSVPDRARAFDANSNIICKIVHKDAIKFLSSFETSTEFWNPKNLSTNRYMTWAYAYPEAINSYPLISIVAKTDA